MAISGIFDSRNDTVNIAELKDLVVSSMYFSYIFIKSHQPCSIAVLHIKTFTNFPK